MSQMLDCVVEILVDLTNPGQFFACCGILELAERLWPQSGVHGAFTLESFRVFVTSMDANEHCLRRLLEQFGSAQVTQIDTSDSTSSPLLVQEPFNLRLDWWLKIELPKRGRVNLGGGDRLKTWAGQQRVPSIFEATKSACAEIDLQAPFDDARTVYDSARLGGKQKTKTISPFYFDSRRDETSLDIGFSPDEQEMSVAMYPAVEALALRWIAALSSGPK